MATEQISLSKLLVMIKALTIENLKIIARCCNMNRQSNRNIIISNLERLLLSGECPRYICDMIVQMYTHTVKSPQNARLNGPMPYQYRNYPPAAHQQQSQFPPQSNLRHAGSYQMPSTAPRPRSSSSNNLRQLLSSTQQHNGMPAYRTSGPSLHSSRPLTSTVTSTTTASSRTNTRHLTGYRADFSFHFRLNSQQAQLIACSRDIRRKPEYTVQVLVRFVPAVLGEEQKDDLPGCINLKVNGRMASLPPALPTSKPDADPIRPGLPINITPICKISPTVPNVVDMTWKADVSTQHCVAVYLVKKLTPEILMTRLRGRGVTNPDRTRKIIKEKLSHDTDIKLDSLRVSLQCPLLRSRMVTPCRSIVCDHIQCFDGMNYLMMNEKKPKWICPVCDKPCAFEQLMIDGLFLAILEKVPDADEINLAADSTWHPPNKPEEVHHISSPTKSWKDMPFKRAQPVIDDDDEDIAPPPKKQKVEDDLIDLTESGDEEEQSNRSSSKSKSSTAPPDSSKRPSSVVVKPLQQMSKYRTSASRR